MLILQSIRKWCLVSLLQKVPSMEKQEVTVKPKEGITLEEQLKEAVQNIHGTITELELSDTELEEDVVSIPADPEEGLTAVQPGQGVIIALVLDAAALGHRGLVVVGAQVTMASASWSSSRMPVRENSGTALCCSCASTSSFESWATGCARP